MPDKPISITRTGDTETATYADGRTETRGAHVPTKTDYWPKGTETVHTPKSAPTLRSVAYTGDAVHLFLSDGSSQIVPNVSPQEWLRVRTAPDRQAALQSLRRAPSTR